VQPQTQLKVRRWYSKRQLADRYNVCPRTFERWVKSGRLPPPTIMPNGRWAWSDREIENFERSFVGGRLPESTAPGSTAPPARSPNLVAPAG
jgi:hypothetical protein